MESNQSSPAPQHRVVAQRDAIERFVDRVDHASIKPIGRFSIKGASFGVFRRCIPWELIDIMGSERCVILNDHLEISGAYSHSIIGVSDTTFFGNVKVERKTRNILMRHNGYREYSVSRCDSVEFKGKTTSVVVRNSVYCKNGEVITDNGSQSIIKLFKILCGSALTERYNAHAEIELVNGASVFVPLGLWQLKEILKDREKPENGNRRSALIHLVKQHKRNGPEDAIRVREHLRGKIECHWRGWDVALWPSMYDVDRLLFMPNPGIDLAAPPLRSNELLDGGRSGGEP